MALSLCFPIRGAEWLLSLSLFFFVPFLNAKRLYSKLDVSDL